MLLTSGPVQAQQIQTHFYDVHGRLQAVSSAVANSGSRTLYGLDEANNRTSKIADYAGARAFPDQLLPGETLLPGQRLVSADNRFAFVLQEADGHGIIYGPNGPIWGTQTANGKSSVMAMQHDGNLVIRGPENEGVWDSGTWMHPGSRLVMQNDGNLVIYTGWTAVWASGTGGH